MPTLNKWKLLADFKSIAAAQGRRVEVRGVRGAATLCLAGLLAIGVGGCKRSDESPSGDKTAPKSGNEAAQLVSRGEKLVRQFSCTSCHSVDGAQKVGSSFVGMYGRNSGPGGDNQLRDEAFLRKAIVSPSPTLADGSPSSMPSYGTMDDETLTAIIAYIRSLSDQPEKSGETKKSDG